jgi:hypothetical protein
MVESRRPHAGGILGPLGQRQHVALVIFLVWEECCMRIEVALAIPKWCISLSAAVVVSVTIALAADVTAAAAAGTRRSQLLPS